MITRSLLTLALCCGCASDNQSSANNTQTTLTGSGSAAHGAAAGGSPDRSKPMTNLEKAYAAFRDHAARKLGVSPDKIQGGPGTEELVKMSKGTVGSVWAYTVRAAGKPDEVRGWATADGTVVTLEQNLGVLLAEAGVWGGGVSPPLTAPQIAERLTWSLGMNHSVFVAPHLGVPAPEIVLKDGAGTLTFVINYRRPGPGGAGGGPRQLTRIEIALTADRRATATQTRIPSP
jgi:hypothetical protein